jgi:hypothetical protein
MDSDCSEGQFEGIDFEWYPLKAEANLKKHKVSFQEAMTVFGDERVLVIPDHVHSAQEERAIAIGLSAEKRLLIVCFTIRGEKLRLISSRRVERWERRVYETGSERK